MTRKLSAPSPFRQHSSENARGRLMQERFDVSKSSALPSSNGDSGDPRRRTGWFERRLIQWTYEQVGSPCLRIELWDGTVLGSENSPLGSLVIRDPRVLWQLFWNPDLAFGECYTDGRIEIRGDLRTILLEINRGLARASQQNGRKNAGAAPRRSHTLTLSKSNVHHHYDLGNEFYRLWLDEQMVYTCAYYVEPTTTLAQAQSAKLDYVSRKLRLKPGDRVLEAGCGWGALALHMARHYGVRVEAYNLSHEQIRYARQRAMAEGLSDRVKFVEADYRTASGQFDVFVSVGMLEHVGTENYRGLGELMSRLLTQGGRGLIHSIGRNSPRPLDQWTEKYIFPGAHPPCLREMMDLFEDFGFSVLDVENLRLHYSRTCNDWLAKFEQQADSIRQMFDERFVRMWRLYLAASSAAFENGDLQLFQVVFARDNNNTLPLTRSDWYAKPLGS